MAQFEYKVIPAPRRPKRAKGVKGNPARFANVLTDTLNIEAASGWEFVRSETLPMDERTGLLRGSVENFQTVMVFRRELIAAPDQLGPIIDEEPPIFEEDLEEEVLADEDVEELVEAEPEIEPEPETEQDASRGSLFARRVSMREGPEPQVSEPDGDTPSRF